MDCLAILTGRKLQYLRAVLGRVILVTYLLCLPLHGALSSYRLLLQKSYEIPHTLVLLVGIFSFFMHVYGLLSLFCDNELIKH